MRTFKTRPFVFSLFAAGVLFLTACAGEKDELSVSPARLTFSAENPQTEFVTITTNASNWNFIDPALSWLYIYKQPNIDKDKLYFKLQDNESTTQQNIANITITAGKAEPVIILIEQEKKPIKNLSVNPSSLTFEAKDSGEKSFTIQTDADNWNYTSETATWIQFNKQDQSLVVTITAENTQTTERKVEINFTAGNAEPVKAMVIQAEKHTLSASPTTLAFTTSETTTKEVTVTTTAPSWDATTSAPWLTLNKSNDKLNVTASSNTTTAPRNATIVFSAGTADQVAVAVSQDFDQLSVSPASLSFTSSETATKDITVTTNVSNWDATTTATWLTLNKRNDKLNVTASSNTTTAPRNATIIFSAGAADQVTVAVSQDFDQLSVSPASLSFTSGETATKDITVTTNVSNWNANTTATWLTLNKSNDKLNVTVSRNTTTATRNGTIIFTAGSAEQKTVSVSQDFDKLSIDIQSLSFEPNETTEKKVTVTTNLSSWSATKDAAASWLTIIQNNNTLTVSPNTENTSTTTDRTATITFKAGYATDIQIKVTQKHREAISISVSPSTFTLSYNDLSSKATTVATNATNWSASTTTSWLSVVSTTGNTLAFKATSSNPNSNTRTGTITVTAPGATSNATVTVTQQPAPAPPPYPLSSTYIANGTPINNNSSSYGYNYTSWTGNVTPNTSTGTPSRYTITRWMNSTVPIYILYINGSFTLDRNTKLLDDTDGIYGGYLAWGTYNSSTKHVTWYLSTDRAITYNTSTRIFDFSGTYNGLPVVIGILPKNKNTDQWLLDGSYYFNVYMNLKLTLSPISTTSTLQLNSDSNALEAEMKKLPDDIKVTYIER